MTVLDNLANMPKEVLTKRLTAYSKGFSFFAPFGTLIFRPFLLNREYKGKGMPDNQRRVLVLQEAIGQTLNVAVHVTSFLGVMFLAKKVLKNAGLTDTANGLIEAIAGNLGSFLGMSFIAPVVGGKVLNKWMAKETSAEGKPAAPQSQAPQAPVEAAPLRRIAPGNPVQQHQVAPVERPAFQAVPPAPVRPLQPQQATFSPFQMYR